MLVDVVLHNNVAEFIKFALIQIGGSLKIDKIETGMYLCPHFNFKEFVLDKLNETFRDEFGGVCDYPEQVLEKFPELKTSKEKYCIRFTLIKKSEQPSHGGWRWNKWGDYIGEKKITTEYLYDEEDVEQVYVYKVYEVLS